MKKKRHASKSSRNGAKLNYVHPPPPPTPPPKPPYGFIKNLQQIHLKNNHGKSPPPKN